MEDIMSRYSKEDIIRMVEEEDVEFIRLQFTDLLGNLKNIAVTTSQLDKVLNNECMFDGSSILGFANVEESDMYLYPDLDTFEIFPWRPQQGKVARFLCDIYYPDHRPFDGDSRYILKKVMKEAEAMGYTFQVGPECEFFLFHMDDDGCATTISHEKGGYFDVGPMDLGENARREMVLTLEDMGFEVESSHHESAPSQHEIDFRYSNALTTADNIMTFRFVVRTIAKRHGLHATFMPKPKAGQPGSGMHINMSLWKDGKNAFYDESGEHGLSQDAYHFIAGVMKHIREMAAITNPTVNSYKRLVPGYEAPVYVAWSRQNRSPLIRIPACHGNCTRVELRSPDPSANPYLTIAACLAAGLEGIREKLTPPERVDQNIFTMTEEERVQRGIKRLPSSLDEAIQSMKESEFMHTVLGDHIFHRYLNIKEEEWEEYKNQITEWEIQQYLHRI